MIQYPKTALKKMIAQNIGANILNGVYWFNYINNSSIDAEYYNLTQDIIIKRIVVSDIIGKKEQNTVKTIIINPNIFNICVIDLLNEFYEKNPNFPKIKTEYNLEIIRQKEIELMVNYLKSLKEDEIDIYLYKMESDRSNTLILKENAQLYKKPILGFYLTDKDIQDVNKQLAKYDKKIYEIQEKECIEPAWGIRYTLYLSKASYL